MLTKLNKKKKIHKFSLRKLLLISLVILFMYKIAVLTFPYLSKDPYAVPKGGGAVKVLSEHYAINDGHLYDIFRRFFLFYILSE